MKSLLKFLLLFLTSYSQADGMNDPRNFKINLMSNPISKSDFPYRKIFSSELKNNLYYTLTINNGEGIYINSAIIWLKTKALTHKERTNINNLAIDILRECTKTVYTKKILEDIQAENKKIILDNLIIDVNDIDVMGKGWGIDIQWQSEKNFCKF